MMAWLRGWNLNRRAFDEDDFEEVDEPGSVDVYGAGLVFLSACASSGLSIEDITAAVNAIHPTGISSKWSPSEDEKFATGQPNPCPCETRPGRTHYLFEC